MYLAPDVNLAEQDGQSVHTLAFCQALRYLGASVTLLVGGVGDVPRLEGVTIQSISNRGLQAHRDLLKVCNSMSPNLIYERRTTPKLGLRIARLTGTPYVIEVNGLADAEKYRGSRVRATLSRMRLAQLYRRCSLVVVPAAGLGTVLEHRYPGLRGKVIVVPNGVDADLFMPQDRQRARRELRLPSEGRIVCFVGKLAPWQGLDTLLDAAVLLHSSMDFRLLIVGQGPLRQVLESKIDQLRLSKIAILWGAVDHSKIPALIAASDVCVAPFSSERNAVIEVSPLKVFEYLAMGRPVVASDVPGVRKLIEGIGVLVDPDSSADLAQALKLVLEDPQSFDERGRRGILLAKNSSWETRARLLLDQVRERGLIRTTEA